MEADTRHHRLVAADENSAVVEAQLRFVGFRNNLDCCQYSRSSSDSEASMGELQLEAEADSHRSTAGAPRIAQVQDVEDIVHRPNRCRGKGQTRRDDDGER